MKNLQYSKLICVALALFVTGMVTFQTREGHAQVARLRDQVHSEILFRPTQMSPTQCAEVAQTFAAQRGWPVELRPASSANPTFVVATFLATDTIRILCTNNWVILEHVYAVSGHAYEHRDIAAYIDAIADHRPTQ